MLPETRPEPGKTKALILAVSMHALLAAVLFFGVQWKRSAPDVVEVELVAPRSAPAPTPEPVLEARPEPRPEPKPEPKIEPKPLPKPDIVEKIEKKPKPEPKKPEPPKPEPPKPEPKKPEPKPEAPKPPTPDWAKELERETTQRNTSAARASMAAALEGEQRAAANQRGLASWSDKVRGKVRGNVTLPPNLKGNPEAVFEVQLLPTGEVMQVRLKRSSGIPALDDAVERAILKSSPMPKPDAPASYPRSFELKYRPIEE